MQQEKKPHARTVILIECCEESGSTDLPATLEALAPRVGAPALVVGLDSGCGNYEQLWGTTSLRGLVNGVLTVEVLGKEIYAKFPFVPGMRPMAEPLEELVLNAPGARRCRSRAPWLDRILDETSKKHFGKPAMWMGEGGTIPFMAMLGEKFPAAQFLITGVLGPHSNAHGPNEFLDIEYAKKLTAAVADVLAAQASQN